MRSTAIVKGGKLIIVGLFGGDITVPTPSFPLRAMSIQGSYVGSLTEMAELLDLVRRKGVPDLPVGTRPLAAVNEALNDLEGRQGYRPAGADAGMNRTRLPDICGALTSAALISGQPGHSTSSKDHMMDFAALRALQAPIKERYKTDS